MSNEVVRACPFHCTSDPLTKLLPLTTRVKFPAPAFSVDGDTEASEGTGLDGLDDVGCRPQLARRIMKSAKPTVQGRSMRLITTLLLDAIRSCFRVSPLRVLRLCGE